MGNGALVFAALLLLASPPKPRPGGGSFVLSNQDAGRYEGLYGPPVYWSLHFLVDPVAEDRPRENTSIRTRGIFSALPESGSGIPRTELCVPESRRCLSLASAAPEIRDGFLFQALLRSGEEAEVVGAFTDQGFFFWSFVSGPTFKRTRTAPERTIEALIVQPSRFVGTDVRVQGFFRGSNLFADLGEDTRRGRDDWVIRHEAFSIWVRGRSPRGKGWRLDPSSRRECGHRIEVTGRLERFRETLYIAARDVVLLGRDATQPCDAANAEGP